jgi:predicted  nucleic acid-binding Zn-ribbon protein
MVDLATVAVILALAVLAENTIGLLKIVRGIDAIQEGQKSLQRSVEDGHKALQKSVQDGHRALQRSVESLQQSIQDGNKAIMEALERISEKLGKRRSE